MARAIALSSAPLSPALLDVLVLESLEVALPQLVNVSFTNKQLTCPSSSTGTNSGRKNFGQKCPGPPPHAFTKRKSDCQQDLPQSGYQRHRSGDKNKYRGRRGQQTCFRSWYYSDRCSSPRSLTRKVRITSSVPLDSSSTLALGLLLSS